MTNNKKPYTTPLLYKVALNPEQAILSACSTMTTNARAGGGSDVCRPTGGNPCKTGDKAFGTGDSGPRLS